MRGYPLAGIVSRDRLVVVVFVLGPLTTSCGGDTSNGSSSGCQAATGCGGDITGLWHVTSMCADLSLDFFNSLDAGGTMLPKECAAVFGANSAQYTPIDATIQFANGQYTEAGSFRSTSDPVIDAGCLN